MRYLLVTFLIGRTEYNFVIYRREMFTWEDIDLGTAPCDHVEAHHITRDEWDTLNIAVVRPHTFRIDIGECVAIYLSHLKKI